MDFSEKSPFPKDSLVHSLLNYFKAITEQFNEGKDWKNAAQGSFDCNLPSRLASHQLQG